MSAVNFRMDFHQPFLFCANVPCADPWPFQTGNPAAFRPQISTDPSLLTPRLLRRHGLTGQQEKQKIPEVIINIRCQTAGRGAFRANFSSQHIKGRLQPPDKGFYPHGACFHATELMPVAMDQISQGADGCLPQPVTLPGRGIVPKIDGAHPVKTGRIKPVSETRTHNRSPLRSPRRHRPWT